jgi:hypothetical protein
VENAPLAYQFHTQSLGQRFGATITKKWMAGLRILGIEPASSFARLAIGRAQRDKAGPGSRLSVHQH